LTPSSRASGVSAYAGTSPACGAIRGPSPATIREQKLSDQRNRSPGDISKALPSA
jgi:hypothetical protein